MLLRTEIKYFLTRNKGRNLLLLLTAAVLIGCMGAYLGTLRANEASLNSLGDTVPVSVCVKDSTGTRRTGLQIRASLYDALLDGGVHDVRCTASAVAAMGEDARSHLPGNGGVDVSLAAANRMDRFAVLKDDAVTFAEGKSDDLFAGKDNLCVVTASFGEVYGLRLGDTFSLPIYARRTDGRGNVVYAELGERSLEVAGIFQNGTDGDPSGIAPSDIYVPVEWLRAVTEETTLAFQYESLSAVLDDPAELNAFKKKMGESGFQGASRSSASSEDNVLSVSDRLFIKTAGELKKNIVVFRRFLFPFFGLVVAVVILTIFLVLRGERRNIAIAASLGRGRFSSGLARFFGVLILDVIGAAAAVPVLCLAAGISLGQSLAICGLFLAVAALGTAAALVLLLRFDMLTMLVGAE